MDTCEEPLTEDLLRQLAAAPNPDACIATHASEAPSLPSYLHDLLESRNMKRAEAIRIAGLNPTFGYQIFKGTRKPSRDKVLQLAFALQCTLKETQHLLIYADVGALYPKMRRDAIIIYGITHQLSRAQTDDELYRFGEQTILWS